MISEVAKRYGKALYELAREQNKQDEIFEQLRILKSVIYSEPTIQSFLASPVVQPEQKIMALKGAIGEKVNKEIVQAMQLLAHKNRLPIFTEIVDAFEQMSDEIHGVSRGVVKSSKTLSPEARKKIEDTVARVTGRKVILNFKEDPQLMGGMVAQVGGWTFDDSIETHLTRMSEDLNRRAN